jgi:hypothetical protein
MAVYVITINERTKIGKQVLAYLRARPEAVTFITDKKYYRGSKAALFVEAGLLAKKKKEEKEKKGKEVNRDCFVPRNDGDMRHAMMDMYDTQ